MSDWQQELKNLMPLALIVGSATRAMVGPKMEKKLGRPLTELHWQVYWEKEVNKQECLARANTFIQCYRQLLAREIIRRSVWEGDGQWS